MVRCDIKGISLLGIICEVQFAHLYQNATPEDAIKQLQQKISRFYHNAHDTDISKFALINFGAFRLFLKLFIIKSLIT